jgi:hydrogenase maturation protease
MLVIGIGNVDRGDDAAGILVAQRLAERGVDARQYAGATLNLIDVLGTADELILVDALVSGASPGTVQVWDVHSTTLENHAFRSYTHEFGLIETIELARALNRLPKTAIIYGIEGAKFVPGAPPSPEVRAAVDRLVDEIWSRLDHHHDQ